MLLRLLPLAAILGFVALGVLTPAPANQADDSIIKIVSSLPRTGSAKGQTDTIVDGIRLAFDEICTVESDGRHTLKVGDKTYTILYSDLDDATAAAGQWTATQETANANLAVGDPNVMVYIGTYNSGAAKISMPILNAEHMLMISPANTSPGLTKPNVGERDEPKCYRPSGDAELLPRRPDRRPARTAAAEWAKDLGIKRVYILDDNEVYGKGVADLFESHGRSHRPRDPRPREHRRQEPGILRAHDKIKGSTRT